MPDHWIETQGEYRGIPPGRRIAHGVRHGRKWSYFELPRGTNRKVTRQSWQRMDRGEIK